MLWYRFRVDVFRVGKTFGMKCFSTKSRKRVVDNGVIFPRFSGRKNSSLSRDGGFALVPLSSALRKIDATSIAWRIQSPGTNGSAELEPLQVALTVPV